MIKQEEDMGHTDQGLRSRGPQMGLKMASTLRGLQALF